MRRLSAFLLLWPLWAACDEGFVDVGDDGSVQDGGVGDAVVVGALTAPNPGVGIEQLQVKGHQRSDWFPREQLDPLNQPEVYVGVERRSLPRQMTIQHARVFHLGFRLLYKDARSSASPNYYWGGHLESFCSDFVDCLASVAQDEPDTGWVGPIFIVFEFFGPSFFDPADADDYTDEDLASVGYPYERYIYQLEMATSFIPREQIFAPGDMQGERQTLREAVLDDGWPSLEELDGKFIFILKTGGSDELRQAYLDEAWAPRFEFAPGDPRFFVAADSPEDDYAAFFSLFGAEQIAQAGQLVDQGFIVHGAGEDPATVTAYEDAGAHLLTAVHIDEVGFMGPARCNPRTAEERCYEPAPHEEDPPELVP